MTRVSVSQLRKRFGSTEVLKGVDLEIADKQFAVLVGPSGCGKSTLLRTLAGLEEVDAGKILFGERDVTRLEPRDRDIAMVFQSYALYPHLSVRDNLAFGLKLRKADPKEIEARVKEASAMLGLDGLLDRLPKALSGGQRQRVAMGRAIVRRSQLFLFDEPLSNLDAALRAQVRVDIRKLHDRLGATSVYVTHDQVEAMTLADVIFVLNQGRVEQSGSPLEVFDHPATKFVASFLGSPAMNFIPAKIEGRSDGAVARGAGDFAAKIDAEIEVGREVIAGVRPHHVVVASGAAEATLDVVLVEALGAESFAHGTVGDQALVVRLDPATKVKKGERVPIAFERVHLFDRETGRAL